MPPLPLIIACLLLTFAATGLLFWGAVAVRVFRLRRNPPTVRNGLDLPVPDPAPRVSLVIPAHNEEDVIDECVRSLRATHYDDLEIIFVLDRCTDRTLAILTAHADADDRIRLLENDACPDDWAGKCHAAHLGARIATGDYLIFTDADTAFDPDLIRATVALAEDRGVDLVSLLSTLRCTLPFERTAQPVASMRLVAMYPINRVDRGPDRSRPFANGQFMLFRRRAYESIGGHTAVRDDLLEDIAFARRIDHANRRGLVLLADGMLRCAMYDSAEAFREGWKRIFIEACKRKPSRLRKQGLRAVTVGIGIPVAQLAALIAGLAGIGPSPWPAALVGCAISTVLVQAWALTSIYRMGGTPARYALYFPAGSWTVARILFAGARDLEARRPIRWAGREYILEPR